MAAGVAVLNGAGELTGSIEIREWGILETPIVLTATNAVGRGYDAVVDALFAAGDDRRRHPGRRRVRRLVARRHRTPLGDHRPRARTPSTTRSAVRSPRGSSAPARGMITMGHKAGIGTSSRVVGDLARSACSARQLRRRRQPAHRRRARRAGTSSAERATRADARHRRLVHRRRRDRHPARRQAARTRRPPGRSRSRPGRLGRPPRQRRDLLRGVDHQPAGPRGVRRRSSSRRCSVAAIDDVFQAVVDATEEAVTNALFVADTVTGVDGFIAPDSRSTGSSSLAPSVSGRDVSAGRTWDSHANTRLGQVVTTVRDCSRRYCWR